MRILVVAATSQEVASLEALRPQHADILITGVGMVATAARCSRALATARYDFALNLGVCGSFDPALPPGTVVHVTSDRIAELGAEDDDRFLTIHDLQLLGENEFPFAGGALMNRQPPAHPVIAALPTVSAITVNTAHGNAASIARVVERFRPQVESMEGAAFMYSCLVQGLPFAQIRAVSNVVETRNRAAWKMAVAIQRLDDVAMQIVNGR
jgi:futalosine hydrolase